MDPVAQAVLLRQLVVWATGFGISLSILIVMLASKPAITAVNDFLEEMGLRELLEDLPNWPEGKWYMP